MSRKYTKIDQYEKQILSILNIHRIRQHITHREII